MGLINLTLFSPSIECCSLTVLTTDVYQESIKWTYSHWWILLWYFHLHVSAGNPAIFRVIFLLQEYSVIKCVKLLLSVEIHMIIDYNFHQDENIKWYKIKVKYVVCKYQKLKLYTFWSDIRNVRVYRHSVLVIMIQKQQENVEYFNYLGSMTTHDSKMYKWN